MKNTSKLKWRLPTLLFALFIFSATNVIAQRTEGVSKVGDRLRFNTEEDLRATIESLEAQVSNFVDSGEDVPDGQFYEQYPTLADFENSLSFQSLRNLADQDEFAKITAGDELEGIKDLSWIGDPVIESLLNGDYVLQVGETIVHLYGKGTTILINDGNESTLDAILRGENPGIFPNVTVENSSVASCSADFTVGASFYTSNSGTFTYTGQPTGGVTFNWNFGDGTTSTLQNPTKTYTSQGLYTVVLTISTADGCVSSETKIVPVNQGCIALFNFDKIPNVPGGISFNSTSQATTTITNYAWDFGDGTTGSGKSPTHIYACDGEYKVKLTITTANGCTRSWTRKVKVTSYRCCDGDIDENETKFNFNLSWDNNRKVKGNANDVQIGWPFHTYKVNAEIKHYKKGFLGIYWPKKANQKVSLIGNVYTKDETGCICKVPFNIGKTASGNKHHVSCTKIVGQRFKTWKDDKWKARFWVDNNLVKEIIPSTTCD